MFEKTTPSKPVVIQHLKILWVSNGIINRVLNCVFKLIFLNRRSLSPLRDMIIWPNFFHFLWIFYLKKFKNIHFYLFKISKSLIMSNLAKQFFVYFSHNSGPKKSFKNSSKYFSTYFEPQSQPPLLGRIS